MKKHKKSLIVILGPTASGKSGLAFYLAKKYNGVIISADSRQIYRGMNIGTAKPSNQEKQDIKHYLIDRVYPNDEYSLADFQKDVNQIINKLPYNRLPFLVGGTGLYISSIVENYKIPPIKPNKALRNKLENKTTKQLFSFLKGLSSSSAKSIDPNNRRHLIRAIEIAQYANQKSISRNIHSYSPYNILQIGIFINRALLYKKINERVDNMIKSGLISEVKKLSNKYSWDFPAMSGIGYKQIGQYLRKEISKTEAIELIKRDTRRYAKRQMTWFRRDKRINWVENRQQAERLIKKFLK